MFDPSFAQPYRLGRKTVSGRFAIPSGIRCTHASTIRKCFREVPQIGIVTTKSIGAQPRRGYREPIYARYAPGCYINAVGLANPGAAAYLAEFEGIAIPEDKFLLVSIIGTDVDSFLEAALTLKPIADGFELNMSCPHAKGYGAEIGQDTELMRKITEAVAEAAGVPVFVKLSSTLPNLAATAEAAVAAGAAGLTLINTVGPALAAVGRDPILSNRLGGLSGDGIRPMGLRAVEQVRARGWQRSGDHRDGRHRLGRARGTVRRAPERTSSASAAHSPVWTAARWRHYLAQLEADLCGGTDTGCRRSCETTVRDGLLQDARDREHPAGRVAVQADFRAPSGTVARR